VRFALVALLTASMLGMAAVSSGVSIAQESEAPSGEASPSIEFPHVPRLVVTVIPTYGKAPLTVGFFVSNANPSSAPFVSYRWSFGDGKFSTLPPTLFFHTYINPGSYVIQVTGTTADGLNSTGTTGVVVSAGP
jgi:PKD repeat protein